MSFLWGKCFTEVCNRCPVSSWFQKRFGWIGDGFEIYREGWVGWNVIWLFYCMLDPWKVGVLRNLLMDLWRFWKIIKFLEGNCTQMHVKSLKWMLNCRKSNVFRWAIFNDIFTGEGRCGSRCHRPLLLLIKAPWTHLFCVALFLRLLVSSTCCLTDSINYQAAFVP